MLGILAALVGIFFAVAVCAVVFVLVGFVCLAVGIARIWISPLEGLALTGVGGILFAVGLLFSILFVWCACKWLPALLRWFVDLVQKFFRKGERRNKV